MLVDGYVHRRLGARKQELFADQRLLRRPWQWTFEGCDLSRHTTDAIRAAGFTSVELERYRLRSVFLPVNEQVAGTVRAGVS